MPLETTLTLTPEEFVAVLAGEREIEYPQFSQKYEGIDSIVIENIDVSGEVILPNNFKAKKNIVLIDVYCRNLRIYGGVFLNFRIYGGVFLNFNIYGGDFKKFIIYGGDFENFLIFGGDFQYFTIFGGNFKNFRISGGDFKNFNITGGNFQEFSISCGDFQLFRNLGGYFLFFRILGGDFKDFRILGGDFQYFIFSGAKCNNLKCNKDYSRSVQREEALNSEEKLNIKETCIMVLIIESGIILSADLEFKFLDKMLLSPFNGLNVKVSSSDIREIILQGAGNATINLEDIAPDVLRFDAFQNNGRLYLTNIRESGRKKQKYKTVKIKCDLFQFEIKPEANRKTQLSFEKSDLGHTQFKNFDFSRFNKNNRKIQVSASNFSAIQCESSQFPKSFNAVEIINGEMYRGYYDLYNYLSIAAEKQKDAGLRFDYFATSQEFYFKCLDWRENPSQKISIWFNGWSNNYGRSWMRPMAWMLGFNFFSFLLYLIIPLNSTEGVSLPAGCTLKDLKDLFSSCYFGGFTEYLLPTHRFDFLFGEQTSGIAKLIDLLTRIINGLMIYQTIVAFRIFSRR